MVEALERECKRLRDRIAEIEAELSAIQWQLARLELQFMARQALAALVKGATCD